MNFTPFTNRVIQRFSLKIERKPYQFISPYQPASSSNPLINLLELMKKEGKASDLLAGTLGAFFFERAGPPYSLPSDHLHVGRMSHNKLCTIVMIVVAAIGHTTILMCADLLRASPRVLHLRFAFE